MTQTKGFRTANRRYLFLFWPAMILYAVALFTVVSFVDKTTAPLWLRIVGAGAITLPVLGVLYAVRRHSNETDEYSRLRHITALRDAGLACAGIAFLVGFLQIFTVLPDFTVFWFGPAYFIAYGLSACFQRAGKTV